MTDAIRCPSCGAANAAGAQWCGQCLSRFDAPAAAPGPVRETPTLQSVPSSGVHRRGDDVVWTCPVCQAVNPMAGTICSVCGTPMAAIFGGVKPRGPKRTGTAVVGLSAVLPGAGHWYAGRAGDAIARGVLFVWSTAIGAYLLTRTAAKAGVFKAIGGVFVITAAATWLITMLEAQRLSRGDAEPLVPGKALLWTSAALTGLLFVGLAAGART